MAVTTPVRIREGTFYSVFFFFKFRYAIFFVISKVQKLSFRSPSSSVGRAQDS